MEFVMEFLLELILDGSVEIATAESKKIPMPVRIIAALIVTVPYLAICGLILWIGIKNRQPLMFVLSAGLFLLFCVGLVYQILKFKRRG